MTHDSEFGAWLDAATRGLPETPARTARLELATHYTDALADHLEHGIDALEARRLALLGLGAPGEVARGLLDTHVGRGQYLVAAGLCLWNLLMQPAGHWAWLTLSPTSSIVEHLLVFGVFFGLFFPTMYVLDVGRMLLEWRLNVPHARPMISLTMAGVAVPAVILMREVFVSNPDSLGAILPPVFAASLALAGAGMLWLSATCIRFASGLQGVGKALALVTGLMGLALFASAVGPLTAPNVSEVARLGYLLASAGHVALWPLLALMFFRMVRRRDLRSMLPV